MRGTATVKRSELYQLVWQQPMIRLAEAYGLSDVGLAKICQKYDIPKPPRGYWARVEHGQTPSQTPLPERDQDDEIPLRELSNGADSPSGLQEDVKRLVAAEKREDMRITIGDSLRGSHKLVRQANKELQGASTDQGDMIIPPGDLTLDISTSKANLRRALLIMDALLKALEIRGHGVAPGPKVTIFDATVPFRLAEPLETRREQPDEHDLDGPYRFGHSLFHDQRFPSGQLTLEIHGGGWYGGYGGQRTWRDTKTHRLEDRLNKFVAGLIKWAALTKERDEERKREEEVRRQKELRREEEARRLAELREQYKVEEARVNELLAQAKNFEESKRVRDLIEAVREAQPADLPIVPGGEVDEWIEWAGRQADRLDPLRPSPPSILDEDLGEEEEPYRRWGHRW